MPLRLLLLISSLAAPALAQTDDCLAVRRVLTLAVSENVQHELRRLELQACGRPVRSACQQLEEFWMLSLALRQPQETTSALEAQRGVWCSRDTEPARALQWPDGQQLRSTSGMLTWPGGTMARSSGGSWSAPNGTLIRSSSGTLTYPGGTQARSSSGRWSLPSGGFADEGRIAGLACANEVQWCRFFLQESSRNTGVMRDFAQLGLGLLASPED